MPQRVAGSAIHLKLIIKNVVVTFIFILLKTAQMSKFQIQTQILLNIMLQVRPAFRAHYL